jgi:hypothetical protein
MSTDEHCALASHARSLAAGEHELRAHGPGLSDAALRRVVGGRTDTQPVSQPQEPAEADASADKVSVRL